MPRKKKEGNPSKTPPEAALKPPAAKQGPKPRKAPKVPKARARASAKVPVPRKKSVVKTRETKAAPAASKAPVIPPSPMKKLARKGQTQMIAFIRDPQCLFTYWEVTPESLQEVKDQLQEEFRDSAMVLRVFRKDASGQVELIQEIFIEGKDMNRYIPLPDPRGTYYLEVAQRARSGSIRVYARSNEIYAGPEGFTGSSWSASSQDPLWKVPRGLEDYFSQEEYLETFLTPGGPSSMDSLRRKLGRFASSHIG